jgi:hypothetical protein
MGIFRRRRGATLGLALVGLGLVLVSASPAAASRQHPIIRFDTPVCTSGLDVSVGGKIDWKSGPIGTVTIDWGDGSSAGSSLPDAHAYGVAGSYTITLTATNTAGSGTARSVVTPNASGASCLDVVSPQPVAESGTLGAGESTQVAVTVNNAQGKAIKTPEPVWLSFAPAPDGGSATACCQGDGSAVPLATTPVALTTGTGGPAGQVLVTYTLSSAPPDSGSDVITASPVPDASALGSGSDSYQYSASPVPLTPPPSIANDCSADVSKSLGAWLRNLPPNATVVPPSGACYQVDEGLLLTFPSGLTIDGGTYENLSTNPAGSGGGGTPRGDPVFDILGGAGLVLENMTIEGANPGGYLAKMAFAAGVQLQGTHDATLSNLTINSTFGDGITLDPLRNSADHKGSGILSPTDNATISNVTISGAGRMGIALVSVNGASISNIAISNVGLDTFDVESDQGNEGTQNVTISGCTASTNGPGDFFADGGAGSGKSTGNITVSGCVMEQAQAGTAIWVRRPSSGGGTTPRGPIVFENDTLACGASTTVSCVDVTGGTVTVQDSSLGFPGTTPAENVYSRSPMTPSPATGARAPSTPRAASPSPGAPGHPPAETPAARRCRTPCATGHRMAS